jgi:HEPN domain-containing protein
LQVLARTRLKEAKTLLGADHPDGAYFLAGYAVECGLKACIAGKTQRHEFPDKKIVNASYTHNLKELVKVANLERERVEEAQRHLFFAIIGTSRRSGQRTAATSGTVRKRHRRSWMRLATGNMESLPG